MQSVQPLDTKKQLPIRKQTSSQVDKTNSELQTQRGVEISFKRNSPVT
jgi:anti-sigma28 factor (negative regulator of flagellin synthesis)